MDVNAQGGTMKGYGNVIKKNSPEKQKPLLDETGRFKTPGQADGQAADLREKRLDG